MFDRIGAKMQAKASMRQASPNPLLVTLVFLLLTTVLFRILSMLLFDPWSVVWADLQEGYTLEESLYDLYYLLQESGAALATLLAVQLIVSAYKAVMSFGYNSYALRLARNEGPGYTNLFDGFAKFFRVLWMNILAGIFTFLWSLLAALPVIILIIAAAAMRASVVYVFLYLLVTVVVAIVAVIMSLRYMLAPYFLLDDPACTAREAIRRSKRAMQGWKMEAFTLVYLSFLGWEILSAMTLNILDIWVIPYQQVTYANFYDCITGGMYPSNGLMGPDHGVPGGSPAPF